MCYIDHITATKEQKSRYRNEWIFRFKQEVIRLIPTINYLSHKWDMNSICYYFNTDVNANDAAVRYAASLIQFRNNQI